MKTSLPLMMSGFIIFCVMFVDLKQMPFSIGFTLSEFSAISTDENWKEAFLHQETGLIHKVFTVP